MSGDKTIKLQTAIERGTETITEIVVSKPKGKHFKKLPTEPKTVAELWPFMCAICNQPPSVLDELDSDDFLEVMQVVENFIPGALQTGQK